MEDPQTPVAHARAAGLRYVHDGGAGIRRLRRGASFRYVTADGRPLRDRAELARIRALAIPPAWTDVWICSLSNGHVQATGRDARGRKQYRYHVKWRAFRDETKFDKMLSFGAALPSLRAEIDRALSLPGLPREKVLATVVRLLELTHIRVGNEEYAQQNDSFGLTTLRNRHVKVRGASLHFGFRGKSGVLHAIDVRDKRLARIVKRCHDLPGHELFSYLDEAGAAHAVDSSDVNDYLHAHVGEAFTAKDFRTWAGTLMAACALREAPSECTETERKRHITAAIETTAAGLGNTPSVCRKCYVHPEILAAYAEGALAPAFSSPTAGARSRGLSAEERAVLALLHQRRAA